MKASAEWLRSTSSRFRASGGISGCAQLTHYTASYSEWGEGQPLILVPGMAGGYELLGPVAKALSKDFRVISYQLRGEDNCFALRQPFGMAELVNDLHEFIEWLCLENPTIVGVSFGGLVALEFAARFPHCLSNLIVQGVGGRFEKTLLQQVAGAVLARFPLPADSPFVNQFFNLLFGGAQKKNALVEFVTRQIWQTDQSVMAHRFQIVEAYQVDRRLERIRVPTLVLAGDRDVLVSQRSLHELFHGIAGAQMARLANCGHLAFATHPDLVAEKVRQFMADRT